MAQLDSAQARLIQTIVWAALLVSQAVYVVVLLSGVVSTGEGAGPFAILPLALALVAVGTGVAAQLCWRRASGAEEAAAATARDPASALPLYLVAWVLDESIGIYGLVLGFLGSPPTVWACFSVAAVLLLLVHRPRSAA